MKELNHAKCIDRDSAFYQLVFDEAEKTVIAEVINHTPDNTAYVTSGGKDTKDYIFLINPRGGITQAPSSLGNFYGGG